MLPRESKRRVLAQQDGTALGISGMYPAAVTRIPELRAGFRLPDCPEADRIAESLVTLPTHPLLSGRDREEVCELMASALKAN
jgi:dTDP-4-amino-4,6-dideoxygalactose transaminase